MATILWGKPKISATPVNPSTGAGTSSKLSIPTPVQDSTQLTSTRGEKHEANIEGGGFEAVRYDRGSHTLEFEVRFAKERYMPFSDVSSDGVIKGTYKLKVEDPNDNTAPYVEINEATGSYEDNLTADDGARRHFFFDSIIPAGGGDQISWSNLGSSAAALL